MENPFGKDQDRESSEKKSGYLYHMVPADMQGTKLTPLNRLKDSHPDLYESKAAKYDGRSSVTERFIPTLEALWNDVLHLTPIHPAYIKAALLEAGLDPKEKKFYQVNPKLLDPEKTTIYLYSDVFDEDNQMHPENFTHYDQGAIHQYAELPEKTKRYYKQMFESGKRPLLFVGVPHILHKGEIDVSSFPIITA